MVAKIMMKLSRALPALAAKSVHAHKMIAVNKAGLQPHVKPKVLRVFDTAKLADDFFASSPPPQLAGGKSAAAWFEKSLEETKFTVSPKSRGIVVSISEMLGATKLADPTPEERSALQSALESHYLKQQRVTLELLALHGVSGLSILRHIGIKAADSTANFDRAAEFKEAM